MANHKSAEKRARQSLKKNLRNKIVKTKVKNAVKRVQALESGSENPAEALNIAKSVIDKAAKKGTLHNKTAARKISKLTKLYNTKVA
ncbi:MAG: 30S ribosomal protein S20 [Desulfobacterales bacterium]|nr:30S ribosomal protein S20 [Desulfobacterales bacterium]MCP4160084.1 30S ribosomal protein S20 [Deltaproteobacteria bacterium]